MDFNGKQHENKIDLLSGKLLKMIKVCENKFKLYELDSRVGLNAAQTLESFPCLYDEVNSKFFVFLGDITIDKFTKTTYMNIVSFAEKCGALTLILIQNRDHVQKGKKIIFPNKNVLILFYCR